MNCVQIQDLFSAYLDHECTPEENELVTSHIANCTLCLEQFQLTKSLMEQLNNLEEQELPEGFHEELMHKIHEMSPAKKTKFVKYRRTYSVIAAAFLFCVIFGVIGSSLLSNFSNQKFDKSTNSADYGMVSEESAESPEITFTADEAPMMAKEAPILTGDSSTSEADAAATDSAFVADTDTDTAALQMTPDTSDSNLSRAFGAVDEKSSVVSESVVSETDMMITATTGIEVPESEDLAAEVVDPSAQKNMVAFVSSPEPDSANEDRSPTAAIVIGLALVILIISITLFFKLRKKRL